MVKKTTLKNGLRIVTIPQKGTRTVTVLVLVGTGSKYEARKIRGVSHFLEHMFFKGTAKQPTPLQLIEPMDRIGGMYNAFTGEDYTGYYAKVDADHFDLAINWVSDIFLHSTLPSKEIEKEKGVVIEELHMHRDIPMSRVDVLWSEVLYGDQPAGWDIVGTQKSVMGLSRNDLVQYMENQYVAANTVVCVAGNVNRDKVERKIAKLFHDIRTTDAKQKVPVLEQQKKPKVLLEYRKTDQTHIALGVRGYNQAHPMKYTQHLLATLLGGMMSSRLWIEIREKMGLAYYVSTLSESDPDTGCVVTTAGIKNNNVEKAIRIILLEYKKIKQEGVSVKELEKAKEHEKGKLALTLDSSDAKAHFYGMQELLQGRILTPEQIYDKIDQVGLRDIKEVAQDIFEPEKLNLVVLGPWRQEAKFLPLLKI